MNNTDNTNKKYELTDETREEDVYNDEGTVYNDDGTICTKKVYRIRALKTFDTGSGDRVCIGDLGGFVESEDNLSQDGNCWIAENACARDNACVCDNAFMCGWACVCGSAIVKDNAKVDNFGLICDNAVISGHARILEDVTVQGKAVINNVILGGNSCINGTTYLTV